MHDSAAKTVRKWIPKWQTNTDPSGRACQAHNTGYNAEQQKKVVNGCVKDIHLNGYCKEDKVTERT